MKVLIVSDTHGRHTGLDRVLEKEGKAGTFSGKHTQSERQQDRRSDHECS